MHQEATHDKNHRAFNDILIAADYACTAGLESRFTKDYPALENRCSLGFNPAYAEGFESMALAIGERLIQDREYLLVAKDLRSRIRAVVSALKMTDTAIYQRHRPLSSLLYRKEIDYDRIHPPYYRVGSQAS